ncbi:sensor histidine kinase [Lutispora thermophila]|uniref:Sensor_kinase_SpoOB-type, alpha-helical domain n=1 Tax=Lutispora thermophila DSM 19022 TaxID=1122184 RepID=A0A1M6IMN1_9FIRM|nr:GHKL domain-containing protein [Lutispora thermophila]SHJ35751.1 Sensor_kinase_SpoOB-type, alpha-helical domain [Lutispora thermophila DSM 19022]
MTIWVITEFLINIIDVSILLYFAHNILSQSKASHKKATIAVIVQSAINTILNHYYGIGSFIGFLLMYLSTGIVYHIIWGWNLVKTYIVSIVGLLIMFIGEIASMALMLLSNKSSPYIYFHFNAIRIIAAVFAKILSFALFYANRKRFKFIDKISETRLYQIGFIIGFNVIISFTTFWFYKNISIVKDHKADFIFITSLTSIIFSLSVVEVINRISIQIEREAKWKVREKEYLAQKIYISGIEDMLKQLRAQRHDFNHHIGCIYGLLCMGKTEEAKIYISKLAGELSSFNNIISVDNPIITSVLNVKLRKAHDEHIKTSLDISLQKKICCDPLYLSIILGNLLDNAIEACSKIPEEERKLSIKMFTKQGNLIIKIVNSRDKTLHISKAKLYENYTSKEDKANHGLGLYNIRKVVEGLNGFMKIQVKETEFEVDIAIPLDDSKSAPMIYKNFIAG